MPEIDCLMLTEKRTEAELIEVEVSVGDFNIRDTLKAEFVENNVPEQVVTFIEERLGGFA